MVPELLLSWDFAWRDGRSAGGKPEVSEDFHHNFLFDDSGDSSHVASAIIAVIHIEGEYAGEEFGPRDAFLFCTVIGIGILHFEGFLFATIFLNFFFHDLWYHKFSEFGVRSEDSVEPCEMDSWWGDESRQLFKEFERGEDDASGAVAPWSFEAIVDVAVCRFREPFLADSGTSSVAHQLFESCFVGTPSRDGSVEGESHEGDGHVAREFGLRF